MDTAAHAATVAPARSARTVCCLAVDSVSAGQGPLAAIAAVHVVTAFAFAYGHLALLASFHRFVFASPVTVAAQASEFCRFYLIQNLFVYCTVVGGTHAWRFARSLQRRELDAALLQSMLTEARLEALRHQIQPHFFFNT